MLKPKTTIDEMIKLLKSKNIKFKTSATAFISILSWSLYRLPLCTLEYI